MNWLQTLQTITDHTDRIAEEYFAKVDLHIEYKKDNSPVSEADQKIEQWVRDFLKKHNPCVGVFGEEFGEDPSDLRLIIDPIDGTRNFIRGIPIFGTLLAIENKGEIIAGLVSAPLLHTRWFAEKGCGAFMQRLNETAVQLKVSTQTNLDKAQAFHASLCGNEVSPEFTHKLEQLLHHTERQRGFGDFYQHMLVAQGSGELAIDPIVKPWDIAPLMLIMHEAGGRMSDLNGNATIYGGSAISSNGLLHQSILQKLL